jgi:hypothetical protein
VGVWLGWGREGKRVRWLRCAGEAGMPACHLSLIEPSALCGGLEHRVLSRDVVRGHGEVGRLPEPVNNVQVGKARLDLWIKG